MCCLLEVLWSRRKSLTPLKDQSQYLYCRSVQICTLPLTCSCLAALSLPLLHSQGRCIFSAKAVSGYPAGYCGLLALECHGLLHSVAPAVGFQQLHGEPAHGHLRRGLCARPAPRGRPWCALLNLPKCDFNLAAYTSFESMRKPIYSRKTVFNAHDLVLMLIPDITFLNAPGTLLAHDFISTMSEMCKVCSKVSQQNTYGVCPTGDLMAVRYPDSGRVLTAQVSVCLGLPMSFLLLKILPDLTTEQPSSLHAAAFAVTLFSMGLMVTW